MIENKKADFTLKENILSRPFFFAGLVLIFLGLFIAFWQVLSVFWIRDSNVLQKIVLSGNRYLSKLEIINVLSMESGTLLKKIDTQKMEKILSLHPRIKNADLSLRAPDTLLVKIEERKAELLVKSGQNIYEVDEALNLLSENDPKDLSLPVLSLKLDIIGKKIDGKIAVVIKEFLPFIKKQKKKFPELVKRISEFMLSPGRPILATIVNRTLLVNLGLKLEEMKIRKLYSALSYFEKEKIFPVYLDLSGAEVVYR